MVRLWLSLCFLLSMPLRADEIEPQAWWNQLTRAGWNESTGLARNFAISSASPARMKRWDKILEPFSTLGFMQYVPGDATDFVRRLNPEQNQQDLPQELRFDPQLLQILLIDRGARISVAASADPIFKSIGTWNISAADRRSSQTFLQWFNKNLGYDAVVLDSKDGLILAALLKNSQELGQGLLLKQSARRWVIKESQARGEALLQMLKVDGSLAIFEILLAKGKTLTAERGAKILLGQSSNWPAIKPDSPPSEP